MKFARGRRRADGQIRASQMLTSAGPGALVDLMEHAVLVKSLDAWRYGGPDAPTIDEPRLAARVSQALRAEGQWGGGTVELRRPPVGDDDAASPMVGVHARLFPSWFVCQGCNGMVQRSALANGRHPCRPKGSPVVPVRFLTSCPKGHLADLPWRAFVHRFDRPDHLREPLEDGRPNPDWCDPDPTLPDAFDDGPDLRMLTVNNTGDIADFEVRCRRCGARRNLRDLTVPKALGRCTGYLPWLPRAADGRAERDPCAEDARLIVRTASNTWFPRLMSALAVPDASDQLRDGVIQRWALLQDVTDLPTLEVLFATLKALREWRPLVPSLPAVLDEITAQRSGVERPTPELREVEWRLLTEAPPASSATDLPQKHEEDWFVRTLPGSAAGPLAQVVLVHAMREVRALLGFYRLESPSLTDEADARGGAPMCPLARPLPFVPAVEISGEGIFLALSEAALRDWERRPEVRAHADRYARACAARSEREQRDITAPSPRLVLLHTLAHLLITSLSLDCGYPASAIRERIYCARAPLPDDDDPTVPVPDAVRQAAWDRSRAGILLYTGAPGTEGTLGGLVQAGRSLRRYLHQALEAATLCSNDPTCGGLRPDAALGRHREGCACHGCVYIAEPSCERMNRDLDRALVVDVLGGPSGLAFFDAAARAALAAG